MKNNYNPKQIIEPFEEISSRDFLNTIWYLYCAYGGSQGLGFYAWGPGDIRRFNEWGGDDFFSSGTWTNDGKFFCCLYENGSLYEINPKTLVATYIGGGGLTFLTLSYDPITGSLYAISDSDILYKIDENTGDHELIAPITGGPSMVIYSGFDIRGTMYCIDLVSDSLWILDIETGEATKVGSLGISINYVTGGDIDKINNWLYLLAYTGSPQLYRCNLTTGECELIATLDGEFSVLVISYEINMRPPITNISFNPSFSNIVNSDDVTVTLSATDNTGVIDTFYRLNYGDWINYETPFNISKDEKYVIEYYSYDYVGNIEDVNVYIYPENHPPSAPNISVQESEPLGAINLTISSTDLDGDDVHYYIDLGDGTYYDWQGPYKSGENVTISYIYPPITKLYEIRAKAKDIYDAESDWTTVYIFILRPREFSYYFQFWFLERFPMLERLLNIYL